MDEVLKQQEKTKEQIVIIDDQISDLKALGDITASNASNAKNRASDTLNTAEEILKEAQRPLAEVDVNATKG